jgi:hypothetical protein
MLFYTAKQSGAPYSPTTAYGAWAAFTNNKIKLTAAETVFINVDGTAGSQNIEIASTSNIWQKFTSSAIRTQISSNIFQEFTSSGIKINAASSTYINVGTSESIVLQASDRVVYASGVGDDGKIPLSGDDTGGSSAYSSGSKITMDPYKGVVITGVQVQRDISMASAAVGGSYRGISPLGRHPRQRMLVSDPANGEVMLGMAVYYRTGVTGTPTDNTGYAGDLLVDY